MAQLKIRRVIELPTTPEPDTLYIVKDNLDFISVHVTSSDGLTFINLSKPNSISIEGSTGLSFNQQANYVIKNFSSFKNYVVTAISGNVSILDDVITYTAPSTIEQFGFIVNNQVFLINIV